MAEDVIPILQPLLPAGAVITGTGNVLLVRADEATLAQVRAALATLDRAPRQLLITVGQATAARSSNTSVRGSATIGSGDVQVGVNQPPRDASGAQVTVRSGSTQDDLHDVSTVRVVEGMEAYVAMGQSRPVTSTTVHRSPYSAPVIGQSTQYRDVMTGFYATPRVSGDRVTLEISPTQQRADPAQRDAIATASLTTTVSGRLGEWIPLGATTTAGNGSAAGIVTWGNRTGTTQYTAWVKVEELPQ